jgi:hypothetical protein
MRKQEEPNSLEGRRAIPPPFFLLISRFRGTPREAAKDIALTTPVAGGDPPKAGGPPGLVPGGAGGLGAISFAKPKRGSSPEPDFEENLMAMNAAPKTLIYVKMSRK